MDLIYYHNQCPDGWCAAWIAKQKYPEAELRPLNHGLSDEQIDVLIAEATHKDVLMLDYSLRTRENNNRLAIVAKSFRILDHHKTAQAVLNGASYAVFDMERSGAGLAWDYLFGRDSVDVGSRIKEAKGFIDLGWSPRPWVVDYVEARDLWKWDRQPKSREVCAFLGTMPFVKEAWDALLFLDVGYAAEAGGHVLANIQNYVDLTTQNVEYGTLFGHKVGVLNVTYVNTSEIGNKIAKTADFSLAWFERKSVYSFSLRSEGSFDVSEIAKKFGGGGHRNAAGFQLSIEGGRYLVDSVLGRVKPFSDENLIEAVTVLF